MNNEELHQLLRQHPSESQLSSAFEREVWSRIQSHENRREEARGFVSPLVEWMCRALIALGRPAVAVVVITGFGVMGAGTGVLVLKLANTQRGELAYLKTVNPLARANAVTER